MLFHRKTATSARAREVITLITHGTIARLCENKVKSHCLTHFDRDMLALLTFLQPTFSTSAERQTDLVVVVVVVVMLLLRMVV